MVGTFRLNVGVFISLYSLINRIISIWLESCSIISFHYAVNKCIYWVNPFNNHFITEHILLGKTSWGIKFFWDYNLHKTVFSSYKVRVKALYPIINGCSIERFNCILKCSLISHLKFPIW